MGCASSLADSLSLLPGKFIEIQFSLAYKMAGARIHIYLLEKSRVVQQSTGERNYHRLPHCLPLPPSTAFHRSRSPG